MSITIHAFRHACTCPLSMWIDLKAYYAGSLFTSNLAWLRCHNILNQPHVYNLMLNQWLVFTHGLSECSRVNGSDLCSTQKRQRHQSRKRPAKYCRAKGTIRDLSFAAWNADERRTTCGRTPMAPGSLLPFAEKLVLAEAVGQRPHMQKAFGLWMVTALEVTPAVLWVWTATGGYINILRHYYQDDSRLVTN